MLSVTGVPDRFRDAMTINRHSHLQQQLERYYEQLQGKEDALLTAEPSDKVRIKQQIESLKREIDPVKREYWSWWKSNVDRLEIPDGEAQLINEQILNAIYTLEVQPAAQNDRQLVKSIDELKTVLTDRETPVTGKLKLAIPLLFIPCLSYEIELNTQGFLRPIFLAFSKLADRLNSLPASSITAPSSHSIAPPQKRLVGATKIPNVPNWVGRDHLLTELSTDLLQGRKVILLHGQSGMGKTSLAVKLLEACGVDSSKDTLSSTCIYDNALYCRVSESDTFSLIHEFLDAFGIPRNQAGTTSIQIIDTILTKLHQERWLVVIDHLDDLMEPDGYKSQSSVMGDLLHSLVDRNHNSQIIITSRKLPEQDLGDKLSGRIDNSIVRVEHISGISIADSIQLLEDLGAKDNQEDLDWIADRVDGNVLTLKLLAAYSKQYPGILRKKPELVTTEGIQKIVEAQLKQHPRDAQELLKRMCVLRMGMDVQALTILRLLWRWQKKPSFKPAATKKTAKLLRDFVNCGLVRETADSVTGEKLYVLPQAIAETLQVICDEELNRLRHYAARLYDYFNKSLEFWKFEDCQLAIERLHFWFKLGNYRLVTRLFMKSVQPYLEREGYWILEEEWCNRLLPHIEGNNRLKCLLILGRICRDTGRWDEAEVHFNNSLTLAQQQRLPIDIARSYSFLGNIAFRRGNLNDAEELYQKSLQQLSQLGFDILSPFQVASKHNRSSIKATCLGGLGDIARKRCNWDEAEKYYYESLNIKTKLDDRSGIATSWSLLGDVARNRGNLDKAEELFQNSLVIKTEFGDRSGIASSLSLLGDIARERGEWDKAKVLYQQALDIKIEFGDRSGMANCWNLLGDIARKQDNWDEAEQLFKQSLAVRMELDNRPGIATSYGFLGDVAHHRGNWDKADRFYQDSLELRTQLKDRSGMASSWNCLGKIELKRGNIQAAETWFTKALIEREALKIPKDIAETNWNFAKLYHAKGDAKLAKDYYTIARTEYTKLGASKDLEKIESEWHKWYYP